MQKIYLAQLIHAVQAQYTIMNYQGIRLKAELGHQCRQRQQLGYPRPVLQVNDNGYGGGEASSSTNTTAFWISDQQKQKHQQRQELGYARPVLQANNCLLYTSPSPRDATLSRMPSSA